MLLVITGILTACASEDAQQKNEAELPGSNSFVTFSGRQPKVNPQQPAKSRTTATHTFGNTAQVLWEATDKIWVQASDGQFYQSEAANFAISATPTDHSRANFRLSQGHYTTPNTEVRYVGTSTNANTVTIAATQTQVSPNDFSHLGTAGDCGTATAHSGDREAGDYEFTLIHKASYLCFVPRCMNTDLAPNIFLTKITVTANKPIAGKYDFTNGTLIGKTPVASSSNTITLTTSNFSLNTQVSSVETNGAYMVIAPGKYNFTISYTIKDPTTNVEGDIVKTLSNFDCKEGDINDITAWIEKDLEDVTGTYYMWDAQQDYWAGHDRGADGKYLRGLAVNEIDMPNASPTTGSPRWYNPVYAYKVSKPATHSANQQPNVNLMCHWAIPDWDQAHWDSNKLWFGYGHLQKGGIWIRKRTSPPMVNKDWDFWGEDFRKNGLEQTYVPAALSPNNNASNNHYTLRMPLPAGQESNFFFLPASGYGIGNRMRDIGRGGHYWTSTPSSGSHTDYAFYFYFNQSEIHVRAWVRTVGSRIARFY